jgi:hypothetical protein
MAHQGFLGEHAKTATLILAEVNNLLESTGATSVTCVWSFPLTRFHSAHVLYFILKDRTFTGRRFGSTRLPLLHFESPIENYDQLYYIWPTASR